MDEQCRNEVPLIWTIQWRHACTVRPAGKDHGVDDKGVGTPLVLFSLFFLTWHWTPMLIPYVLGIHFFQGGLQFIFFIFKFKSPSLTGCMTGGSRALTLIPWGAFLIYAGAQKNQALGFDHESALLHFLVRGLDQAASQMYICFALAWILRYLCRNINRLSSHCTVSMN